MQNSKVSRQFKQLLTNIRSKLEEYLKKSSSTHVKKGSQKSPDALLLNEIEVVKDFLDEIKELDTILITKRVRELLDTLLKAKFDSLKLNIAYSVSFAILDRKLEESLQEVSNFAKLVYPSAKLKQLMENLILKYETDATLFLYTQLKDRISKKLNEKELDSESSKALRDYYQLIQEKYNEYKPLFSTTGYTINDVENLRKELVYLEPDLKNNEARKMYEWGVKAATILGASISKLHNRLIDFSQMQSKKMS